MVVAADSDLFGDDCIGELDHERPVAEPRALGGRPARSAARRRRSTRLRATTPHWAALKAEVDALRLLQRPDGSVDLAEHDAVELRAQVDAIIAAIKGLAPRFPHQADYLDAVAGRPARLGGRRLRAARLHRPRSSASAPTCQREDGIQHLVVFPMYKQNGSRDKVFEALIVSVPWPEWLAGARAHALRQPEVRPGHAGRLHRGLRQRVRRAVPGDGERRRQPVNHFGGDLLRPRGRALPGHVVARGRGRCGSTCRPTPPRCWQSEQLSRDAYELWDLIHDRAHSHGDLPFDPFMIRQRMPYWMYSLEELRCDLTAFSEAVELEGEGFAFARHVQYAILFDRLFRFPITGPRVRNYDGLGGQLLFAYLHETRRLHWTDNRLSIEWEQVADGVLELRERVEALYRSGIQRTKLQHWAAAHDLVAEFVPPATGSRWVDGVRDVRRRRPTRSRTLTRCSTTSSRSRCSTCRCSRSSPRSRWPRDRERR